MLQDLMLENRHIPGVNPLICGMESCAPGHSYGPAKREYYLIHYVAVGNGVLYNERGIHPVRQGQLFVIRPGEVTTYVADVHTPWRYIWVGFETSLDFQDILSTDVQDGLGCGELFEKMLSCGTKPEFEYFICGKVYELLFTLRQTAEPLADSQRYVRLAQDFICANYMREITVEGMARNLGLSRSYFSRLFKAYTGKSPQAYLVDFRLERAAELLLRKLPCAQAAAQTGYTDPVQFSRMFHRRYGIAPSRYQSSNKREPRRVGFDTSDRTNTRANHPNLVTEKA
jgi:AraC-like DNA-binding protein